jgi:4-amino-4-deoxy-L-arabinose transferase-like glycosyltransferase
LSGLGLHLGTTDTSTTAGDGFGGPGGLFNNGPAGPFRLFDQQLGGQASWLLPLSLVGLLLTAWRAFEDRATLARSRRGQAGIVFGTWLLGAGAFFSVANFFHSYYLVTLGPPIATLAAIGLCSAWRAFRAGGRLAWLLPAALLGTALVQVHLLSSYPAWSQWLSPLVVTGATLGAALLTLTLVRERCVPVRERRLPLARTATSLAMMALLVAPTVWSGYTTLHSTTFGIPAAGPQVAGQFGGFGGTTPPAGFGGPNGIADDGSRGARVDGTRSGTPDGGQPGSGGPDAVDSALVSYLEANQGSATYLAATMNSNSAASLILASGQPVMSLGGFSGDDPILTVDQFASLVSSGQVRYVLLGGGGGPGGRGSNAAISQWVQASGSPVTLSAASGGFGNQLYDLSSLQGAAA